MKNCRETLVALAICSVLLSGCTAAVVTAKPPSDGALKSLYRKTVEVLVISCQYDSAAQQSTWKKTKKREGEITIVESTGSGERFTVHGCLGAAGDRFKISY